MRKWMTWMITWILFAAVLSACGKEADDKKLIPKPEKKQEADAETETKTEANAEAEARKYRPAHKPLPDGRYGPDRWRMAEPM